MHEQKPSQGILGQIKHRHESLSLQKQMIITIMLVKGAMFKICSPTNSLEKALWALLPLTNENDDFERQDLGCQHVDDDRVRRTLSLLRASEVKANKNCIDQS